MFVLEPQRQATTGTVTYRDKTSNYLDAMWDQGYTDSVFNAVRSFEELRIADRGPVLSPEDATARYGLPGLDFTKFKTFELTEERAQILNDRRQKELDRMAIISGGMQGAGRFTAGMGSAMLASVLNPIDFASMFVPVVGSSTRAAELAATGARGWRVGMAKGLIQAEKHQSIKLLHPAIDASVGQALVEIPVLANKMVEINPEYGVGTSLMNIGGAAVLGTGIRYSIDAAVAGWKRLRPETKQAMVKEAVNQILQDQTVSVAKYVEIDEAVLLRKVQFDEAAAAARLLQTIDVDRIAAEVKKLYPNAGKLQAAMMIPREDGTADVRSGFAHWAPEVIGDLTEEELSRAVRGYTTESGVFIHENEVAKLRGLDFVSEETFTSEGIKQYEQMLETRKIPQDDEDILMDGIKKIVRNMRGMERTDKQIVAALESAVNQRAENYYFSRPEIREKVQKARDAEMQKLLEQERAAWDEEGTFKREVQDEIKRQQDAGRVLTPDQIRKYSPERDVLKANDELVKNDITALEQQLGAAEQNDVESRIIKMLDKAIDALGSDQSKLMSDPFLIETLGKPALKALLVAIRELYRGGLALNKAIDQAITGAVPVIASKQDFEPLSLEKLEELRTEAIQRYDEIEKAEHELVEGTEFAGQSRWSSMQQITDVITELNGRIADKKESTQSLIDTAKIKQTILNDIEAEMQRLVDEETASVQKSRAAAEQTADEPKSATPVISAKMARRSFLQSVSVALGATQLKAAATKAVGLPSYNIFKKAASFYEPIFGDSLGVYNWAEGTLGGVYNLVSSVRENSPRLQQILRKISDDDVRAYAKTEHAYPWMDENITNKQSFERTRTIMAEEILTSELGTLSNNLPDALGELDLTPEQLVKEGVITDSFAKKLIAETTKAQSFVLRNLKRLDPDHLSFIADDFTAATEFAPELKPVIEQAKKYGEVLKARREASREIQAARVGDNAPRDPVDWQEASKTKYDDPDEFQKLVERTESEAESESVKQAEEQSTKFNKSVDQAIGCLIGKL